MQPVFYDEHIYYYQVTYMDVIRNQDSFRDRNQDSLREPVIVHIRKLTEKDNVRNYSNVQLFKCEYCDATLTDKSNLKRHVKTLHEKTRMEEDIRIRYLQSYPQECDLEVQDIGQDKAGGGGSAFNPPNDHESPQNQIFPMEVLAAK